MKELLKKLCSIPAVSGREEKLREFIINEIKDYAEYSVDQNGNLICFKRGKSRAKKKVMVDAHMDEVGLIASYITDNGFVRFETVGGIDAAVMLARKVVFENGTVGVVGMKPVHMLSGDEKKTLPKADSLYIDIGASTKEEAEKVISVGDTAVFYSEPLDMGNNLLARAIDDRAGVAVLISLLKGTPEYDFYATFTVKEEVGLRGAKTATFTVSPDAAVILEATTAADIYGVASDKKVCSLGQGPAISFMDRSTLYNKKLFDLANALPIKHQVKEYVSGGNNAGAVHLSKGGVPTLTVSLPTRYIHSPSCLASLLDLEDMYTFSEKLIALLASGEGL
ncbi:MAG: M42 family peptidase [Clostridia bacterium]|nr:M42 family peptidase [Clostridia bacterium]